MTTRVLFRSLLIAGCLILCSIEQAHADGASTTPDEPTNVISANPGATNIVSGSGALGHLLGLGESGIQLGGVWVGDGNVLLSGGTGDGAWTFNSLLIADLNIDFEKAIRLPGAMFGAEFLQFDGQDSNGRAGVVTGYNGLPGPPPLHRSQLYQLWWRQELFREKLIFRVGKSVPTYDFGNVLRPLSIKDDPISQGALSSLLYTPIFVSPSLLGVLPGYYNSAYGVTVTIAPAKEAYVSVAVYDGNLAHGKQTGTELGPTFNGYYLGIEEVGYSWLLGAGRAPGTAAIGAWVQTGRLTGGGVTESGAEGFYTYASQRMWGSRDGRGQQRTIVALGQFGINNSKTMLAHSAIGLGVTAFGLVPRRPADSMGVGMEASWLNQRYGFRGSEVLLQTYYSAQLLHIDPEKRRVPDIYAQPTLTVVPNPGLRPDLEVATIATLRLTALF